MLRRQKFLEMAASAPVIAPSMLACDFTNLEREVKLLEDSGVQVLHLDIMDGIFVPNLTFGMMIVKAIRRLTELPLDVHLMITDPARYAKRFYEAGADNITFHIETVDDPRPLLEEIEQLGAGKGLTLNPNTPVADIEPFLAYCDMVLVMSVEAGFGGQSFIPESLDRIRRIREIGGPDILIEVDGGINRNTIAKCAEAGVQLFVTGSAYFGEADRRATLEEFTSLARSQ